MRITHLVCLGLSLVACRDGGGGDDTPPGVDAPPGGSVTIQEIQNDAMPVGTPVELDGVVILAIDTFGARTGDIWVGEPGGGEFSGIKVFGAPLDQIAALAPGDIVTITNAEKDEFALTADTTGRKVTEIKGAAGGMMAINKTGTGALPTPTTVDALAISLLPVAEQDAAWEKFEGVLITVTNARQLSGIDTFGTNPDQKEFEATGGVAVQSVLADLGANAVVGTCYQGITGIGDYFFNYLVLPRTTADLVDGGTGCAAQQIATVTAIQTGTTTGSVVVNDVFVVALSSNKKQLWISQSLNGASNEGIFVFRGTGATVLDANIVPGAKVNVTGTTKEQNNDMTGDTLTQIQGATVTFVAAPTTPPVPVATQQASTLVIANTGEPFESVLVTLTNVKINVVGDPTPGTGNFGVGQLQQGATTFLSDDDTLLLNDPVGTCYATITGMWTYQVFDNAYGLLPISKTAGGACP